MTYTYTHISCVDTGRVIKHQWALKQANDLVRVCVCVCVNIQSIPVAKITSSANLFIKSDSKNGAKNINTLQTRGEGERKQ